MNIYQADQDAAKKVSEVLKKPVADDCKSQSIDSFDPWELFPSLYGSYDSRFDECAIAVLEEILNQRKIRNDLAAEMFREILCTAHLCDYGSSPRHCFATSWFETLLPDLILKWKKYSETQWGF